MILYYLSETFKSFRRAKLASFITVITTTIAVMITSFALLLLFFSNTIEEKLKNSIEINLFLVDSVSVSEMNGIKRDFQIDDHVKSATYVSKEDAVENFIQQTGQDFRSVLEVNPLPASFVITIKSQFVSETNIRNIVNKYEQNPFIDEVTYDYGTTLGILKILDINKTMVMVLSAILIIIAIYFVYSNNKLLLMSKKDQYNTMKLVGAKLSLIKIPIILNGIILGVVAAILCMIFFNFSILLLTKIYYNLKFINILYTFNVVIFILGILFGLVGSIFAVKGISLKVIKF